MVSELSAKLAEKTLAEMMLHHRVSDQAVRALANAALLLEEYAYPIPPLALDLLTRIHQERHTEVTLNDPDERLEQETASDARQDGEETRAARRLMRLFRSLRPGAKT